jgi:hypothetical protein
MTKLICLIACLAFLRPALAAGDKDLHAGGIWAKIVGQSGKIDLAPSSDVSSDPNKIRIQVEALRQLDDAGKVLGNGGASKHSFQSFATQDFTFGALEDTTYGGVKCVKLPFTSTLAPGSVVEIQVFLFKENGTIAVGDDKFAVTNNTMKFNVKLSDWVWCGDGGVCQGTDGVGASVELHISITSREQAKKTDSAGLVYALGGGAQMRLSDKIQVDGGSWTQMAGGGPTLSEAGATTSKFTLKFPKFSTSALYDPDITYGASTTSTATITGTSAGSSSGSETKSGMASTGRPKGIEKLILSLATLFCLRAATL